MWSRALIKAALPRYCAPTVHRTAQDRGCQGRHEHFFERRVLQELGISNVLLTDVEHDLNQLEDSRLVLALGQRLHGGGHQVELLLQIVETDLRIDSVPVQ